MFRPLIAVLMLVIIFVALGGCVGEPAGSTVLGNVSDGFGAYHAVSGVLIVAVPRDGGATVHTMSDEGGNYSLGLRPGVRYDLSGMRYDSFGQYTMISFRDSNGSICDDVMLAPGETAMIETQVYWLHPPKSFSMKYDPVTGTTEMPAPPEPVSISGHVYVDGKAVSGASVEAVSAYGLSNAPTVTDEGGFYRLGLDSRTQYKLTATYQGLQHSIWPVFVRDNETGVYDVNLTPVPRTTLDGIYTGWGPGQEPPASITIEAIPAGGGAPVTVNAGPDYNFSMDVEPLTYYDLRGRFTGSDGYNYSAGISYRTGIVFQGFMLHPNETALVYYFTYEDNVSRERPTAP